jgi:adenylate cyclase
LLTTRPGCFHDNSFGAYRIVPGMNAPCGICHRQNKLQRSLQQQVAEQLAELERIGRLKKFLPPQLAELIVSSGGERLLESHRREITVVFCDLRGFTAFSETAEPEEVIDVLREYYAALWCLISEFAGTLQQFTGDGLMVFFNDPIPCSDPAAKAVRMAVAMRQRVSELGKRWQKFGYELDFGIGISLGFATLGKIGFEGQFNYRAVGTVTNLAARLCAEARGGQILISQRVYAMVEELIEAEPVEEELLLKGFHKPVMAFDVLRLKQPPAMDPRVDMTASGDTLLGHRRVEKIGLPHAARYLRLNRRCHISGHFSG